MSVTQKKVFSALILLCAVLVFGACSPGSDPVVPTTTVIIKNIPATILNTKYDSIDEAGLATFKVYVQLSSGITANAVSTAMGDVKVKDPEFAILSDDEKTYTVTIPVYRPINNTPPYEEDSLAHKPDLDRPNDSVKWSGVAVVISPEFVENIFDIDSKVGFSSPSSNSTVTFDWKKLMSKKFMDAQKGADGLDNYKRIYGKEDWYDGVVVTDDDIKYTSNHSERPPRAGDEIKKFDPIDVAGQTSPTAFGMFRNPNDN